MYNEFSDIIDFMSIRGSKQTTFLDADSVKLTSVDLPKLPPELIGVFNTDDWFRVYVNGIFVQNAKYTYEEIGTEIHFNFNTGSLSDGGSYPDDLVSSATDLGYILSSSDEIGITGKFIEL